MSRLLKQSTAITLRYGPFVDSTDGVTAETGLTISQADVRLSKAGGAFAQKNDATAGTHDENGWYSLPLNTTDTGTLGSLSVAINETGALPVWEHFIVVPANVFDSLVSGSDNLNTGIAESVTGAVGSVTGAVGSVTGAVGSVSAAVVTDAASRTASKATGFAVAGDAMTLAADAIKAVSYDESTAFPLKSDDSGSTQIARTGADGDTLETISDEVALIPTTAMRGTDSAALASVCTETRLSELDAANLPSDVGAIPTTPMRGTDGANTAVPDVAGTAATLHVDSGIAKEKCSYTRRQALG